MISVKDSKKILWIDDDRMMMVTQKIVNKAFSSESLEYNEFDSRKEDFEKAHQLSPDIVPNDIMMPS